MMRRMGCGVQGRIGAQEDGLLGENGSAGAAGPITMFFGDEKGVIRLGRMALSKPKTRVTTGDDETKGMQCSGGKIGGQESELKG